MGDDESKVVLHRLDAIDRTLTRITDSIDRLVLVEERQAQTHQAVERSFRAIDALEKRITPLELSNTINARTSVWIERALIGCVGALGMFVLKSVLN